MNLTRLQGWALLVILPIDLLSFVLGDATWFGLVSVLTVLFFIFGIPAVRTVQSMGSAGLAGILLVELAALIAIGINLFAGDEVSEILIATSVIAGAAGRLIVGWLTTRESVFPAWAGWAFLAQGLLNLAGYLFLYDLGPFGSALGTVTFLLDSAAVFGYGLTIARQS